MGEVPLDQWGPTGDQGPGRGAGGGGIRQALEQQPDEPSLVKLKNDLTEAR